MKPVITLSTKKKKKKNANALDPYDDFECPFLWRARRSISYGNRINMKMNSFIMVQRQIKADPIFQFFVTRTLCV